MITPNLMDAIRTVKENERIASEKYAQAARNLVNPVAKELFESLSEFENYHLKNLTLLEESLIKSGKYIHYEGMEFPQPPTFEIEAALEPDKKSVMQIISDAKDLEKKAEKTYASMAADCNDPQGKEMFNRFSSEELKHYEILLDAYWSLNETGKWKRTHP